MIDRRLHSGNNELEHLARTFRSQGLLVTVRCVVVQGARGRRFEVSLWGDGASAIVDVPGVAEADLPKWIDAAADGFVAALALRSR